MATIQGYDNSFLFDESAYKDITDEPEYFEVDGEEIKDYLDSYVGADETVYTFDNYYFRSQDVDDFISWLIETHRFRVHQLLDYMTPTRKREFLVNGFKQNANDFIDLFNMQQVERDSF